jgi:hypothetical protein
VHCRIIRTDRRTFAFQLGANQGVTFRCLVVERKRNKWRGEFFDKREILDGATTFLCPRQ